MSVTVKECASEVSSNYLTRSDTSLGGTTTTCAVTVRITGDIHAQEHAAQRKLAE